MISLTIIICILIGLFSYGCFQNADLMEKSLFYPYRILNNKEWWRWFTSIFSHGDLMHLIFNLFAFFTFGEAIEKYFELIHPGILGKVLFIGLFFGGGIFSHIYPYFKNKNNYNYRALGASGGVSAIVFAFIILAPFSTLGLMFIPIPIPAWLFGLIYLGFEIYASKRGNTGIGHDAHIGGAIFGILFILIAIPGSLQNLLSNF